MSDDAPATTSAMPACVERFLTAQECRSLIAEIDAAHSEPAKIWLGDDFGVHAESRLGSIAALAVATETWLHGRLWDVMPELEQHFGCNVGELSAVTALIYGRGDHFAAHSDGGSDDDAPPEVRRRRVSLVVALNDGASDFSGGELHFYPGCLPEDAERAEQIVRVRSEPGLLISFHSPMTHRVTPVLDGRRYSLALWALAPE